LLQSATQATRLVGPAIGGVLIVALGAPNVLWVDASTYLVSAVVLGMVLPAAAGRIDEEAPQAWLAGVAALRGDRVLGGLTGAVALFEFGFSAVLVAIPVLVVERLGGHAEVAGGLFAALGGGALVGSFVAYRLAARVAPLRLSALAAMGQALPLWLLPLQLPAVGTGLVLAASGVCAPIASAPFFAFVTARLPARTRTSALAAMSSIFLLAVPVSFVLAGPLIDTAGLRPTLLLIAGIVTCGALGVAAVNYFAVEAASSSSTGEGAPPHSE
jgi:predicted MFS family arabinose efflux permease